MPNRSFLNAKAIPVALILILVWAFALSAHAGPRRTIRPRHGDTPTGIGGESIHPNPPGPPSSGTNTPGGGLIRPE